MKQRQFIRIFCLFGLLMISCERDMSPLESASPPVSPVQQPTYSNHICGQVLLENQSEHSNCLVYIDSLNIGTGTDSSGFYSFQFLEKDSAYTGIFKVYYFLYDYDLDSAQIKLVNGKVQLDTCDVDSTGTLPTKQMNQILLIDGHTGRYEYRVGDTMIFTARFTNLTDRTLYLFIVSVFDELGYISLYRGFDYPYYLFYPWDPSNDDLWITLYAGGIWSAEVGRIIPSGTWIDDVFRPLEPAKYIVIAHFDILDRDSVIYEKMNKFIHDNWPYLHRGREPQIDRFPNKYKYPVIQIME